MEAAGLLEVLARLEGQGVDLWLDGGWGVDALLGQETREPDDLDLVAELRDSDRIIELLHGLVYDLVSGGPPKSFAMVDRLGRQADVHPVTFDAEGGGVYEMEEGRQRVYPAEGFSGRAAWPGGRCAASVPRSRCLSTQATN